VLDAVETNPANAPGLISALAWLPFAQVQETIRTMLAATPLPWQRRIGLAACALHRQDPGRALDEAWPIPIQAFWPGPCGR
jgi:hypothetical protein